MIFVEVVATWMTEQVRTSEQAYNDIPQCNSDEGGKDAALCSNSYLWRLYFRPTARKGISSPFFFPKCRHSGHTFSNKRTRFCRQKFTISFQILICIFWEKNRTEFLTNSKKESLLNKTFIVTIKFCYSMSVKALLPKHNSNCVPVFKEGIK